MSIPAWASPGKKVVCVRVFSVNSFYTGPRLEKGRIYTVTSTHPGYSEWELAVAGIENPNGRGPWWAGSQFRPAIEPKTEAEDVAMFHDIARQKLPEAV